MKSLTIDFLKSIPNGDIFARGTFINSTTGIHIPTWTLGKTVLWIAKKSNGDESWAIYTGYDNCHTDWYIKNYGFKIMDERQIKELTGCDDEFLKLYRK